MGRPPGTAACQERLTLDVETAVAVKPSGADGRVKAEAGTREKKNERTSAAVARLAVLRHGFETFVTGIRPSLPDTYWYSKNAFQLIVSSPGGTIAKMARLVRM